MLKWHQNSGSLCKELALLLYIFQSLSLLYVSELLSSLCVFVIAVKFLFDIHVLVRMNCNKFGDP